MFVFIVLSSNFFFTRWKCGRAVGSHANLHAVRPGAHGGRSPLSHKIEMFLEEKIGCSDSTTNINYGYYFYYRNSV